MTLTYRTRRRTAATLTIACAGLVLASATTAVDLRDGGRKYEAASKQLVVLAQGNDHTAGATSFSGSQVHWLLPDRQLVTDQERLRELRCRRRNQPGSNCRASL